MGIPETILPRMHTISNVPNKQANELEKVFGRYPEDESILHLPHTDPSKNFYCAFMDLDTLREHVAVEESFKSGATKPATSCYNRILRFIDYILEDVTTLVNHLSLDATEIDKVGTFKKYQVEILLDAACKSRPLLEIYISGICMEDDCWEVVAEILATNSNWVFGDVYRDATTLGLFARSLAVHGSSLTYLNLSDTTLVWDEEVAKHIKLIFEYCPNLERIEFWGKKMTLDGGRVIGQLVANKKSLSTLVLGLWRKALGTCALLCEAFKADGSLKQLQFYKVEFGDNLEWLIHAATLIETLELQDITFGCISNPRFFQSLETNIKLKHLSLGGSRGLENLGSFENLMGAVRGSMSLERIDLAGTKWSVDGKAALVQEALDQSVRQRDYLSVLGNEPKSLPMKRAISGRLFLCGQPFAGKSQLANTMMQEERSTLKKFIHFFERTTGIEIQTLRNDKEMQVVIWDLAGQEIFRALHEHLFPTIRTTCLYLFVFNPFECCGNVYLGTKILEDAFEEELKVWLRFLCTNSNVSKGYLPHVVVVITHHDMLGKPKDVVVEEVKGTIEKVSKEFEGFVVLSKDPEHIFCVNAHNRKDIQRLLPYVYEHFRSMSTIHVGQVSDVCIQMQSFILKNQGGTPFMTIKDFNHLCKKENPTKKKLRDNSSFVAMRKYLHDVGTIIDLAEEDLIITNPNWLTNDFLGKLMSNAHGFGTSQGKSPNQLGNGYVNLSQLNSRFDEVKKGSKKYSKLDNGTLRRILIGLDLCYEVDTKFFVPILFESSKSELASKWSTSCEDGEFLGVRLSCAKEKVTYLSTALFSRFQVYMHGRSKEIFDKSLIFKNMLNCIRLIVDGCEVLIECDYLKGQHVDVLLKISRTHNTAMEDAWTFMTEKILMEIRKFYAHPKGAPGVALGSEIIQRECVERPTPCHLRGKSQAVSISQLKESLNHSLEKVAVERLKESGPSLLHHHTWPEYRDAGLQIKIAPALDLLRGCPDAKELQAKVDGICGKRVEKSLELQEHEKTRNLIAKVLKKQETLFTGSMPSIPYVTTKDVKACRRFAAKVNFAIPMKLHFMCESRFGEHLVPNQKGYDITVEPENRDLLRFVVQSSIKCLDVLAKVAMKTTIGVSGDLPFMPLFAGEESKVIFVGGAVTAEKLLNEVKFHEAMFGEGSACIEDWPYMKDKLEPKLRDQYGDLFGLQRVEYIEGSSEASGGWLCRKCIEKDKGIISKVSNVALK